MSRKTKQDGTGVLFAKADGARGWIAVGANLHVYRGDEVWLVVHAAEVLYRFGAGDVAARRLCMAQLSHEKLATEEEIAAAKALVPKLRRAVIEGVAAGKQARVYVELLGRPVRAKLIGADEQGVTVSASGIEARVEWSSLSHRRFYGIVKKYTDDSAALGAYCRGMGLAQEDE